MSSSQTNRRRESGNSNPVIQPVTRAFPATQQCYEDSNIPLSVTITPYTELLEKQEDATCAIDSDENHYSVQSLSHIPKCYHCGAPHANDQTFVQSSIHNTNPQQLYCLLCHQVFVKHEIPPSEIHDEDSPQTVRHRHATEEIQVFALPLRLPSSSLSYRISARSCPVLWYICLDGGSVATSSGSRYWQALASALQTALASAPPHVHVALLIAAQRDDDAPKTLAIYDLRSAIPKLHRYSSDELACTETQILTAVLHAAVPVQLDGFTSTSPSVHAVLRSLMDYPNCCSPHPSTSTKFRCPVGWVTEVVVAALAYGAVPAGQRHTPKTSSSLLPYAGVKLTFCLADRPAGLSNTFLGWSLPANASFVGGGGGYISTAALGERYSRVEKNTSRMFHTKWPSDPLPATELTPQQLMDRYHLTSNCDVPNYYADLGRQCADAAVGVDLLLLFTSTTCTADSAAPCTIPDFCLPLYLPLTERSGAPGPLIFDLAANDEGVRWQLEVLSRAPWQPGCVFGAELRVRVSPGLAVDPTTVSVLPEIAGPQLAPIYNEAGLIGPASSVDASTQLWRMGTTDRYTSFTLDLALQHKHIRDQVFVDGFGEMNLFPVVQVCFAYTTIVSKTDPITGCVTHQTVRQMRISSRRLSLAYTVEALYATIDTEALAVVLFHRIALASFQDGIVEASNMAQQWLQSLLVCVYRSALAQWQVEHQYNESGIEPDPHDLTHRYFYPGERLLFLEGELSAEDVMLAQGHERLRPVVLMVYLLLQSDPLRMSAGSYRPSHDCRCAALSQMSSMTPSALTRCIAPRLQLWESGEDIMEPIWEVLDLRSDAVQTAVLEGTRTLQHRPKGSFGLILLLDTPEQIVVMDARSVILTDDLDDTSGARHSGTHRATNTTATLVMSIGLRMAVEDAARSYRTQPRILVELQNSSSDSERTLLRLVDHLLEDTAHAASSSENFADWKAKIAQEVLVYVFMCCCACTFHYQKIKFTTKSLLSLYSPFREIENLSSS